MLSRAMQIQAVADLVACRPPAPGLSAGCFSAPWDICARALLPLFEGSRQPTLDDTQEALLTALANRADREDIINILKTAPGDGPRRLPSFDDVMAGLLEPEDLWPSWIPSRLLTLLGAASWRWARS